MSGELESASFPLLTPLATFSDSDAGLVVDTPGMSYTFHDESAAILRPLLNHLDGSMSVSELAKLADKPANAVAAVLNTLAEDDQIFDARAVLETSSPSDFIAAYRQLCAFWSRAGATAPFWTALMSGKATRNIVLGWGVEFYHYVDSANKHMAASAAFCQEDYRIRHWLAEHYVEEHDHNTIFLDGLVACGLDREKVQNASPLPSTTALINFLVETAMLDTLRYAGIFGIMRGNPDSDSAAFYNTLREYYGFAVGFIDAVNRHASLDEELDHDELVLNHIVDYKGEVTPEMARRIVLGANDAIEHFTLYFQGIYDSYSDPAATVPRRRFDIRSVL